MLLGTATLWGWETGKPWDDRSCLYQWPGLQITERAAGFPRNRQKHVNKVCGCMWGTFKRPRVEHNNCKTHVVLLHEISQLKCAALAVLEEAFCLKSTLREVISASVTDSSFYQNLYFCCIKKLEYRSEVWTSISRKNHHIINWDGRMTACLPRWQSCLCLSPAPAH